MIEVTIKNAGKLYTVNLESNDTGLIFKQKIQQVTSIPPERQKILIKGGKVHDDATIESLNLSQKTPIMVLGTPDSGIPKKPIEKQVFLEDLNEGQNVQVDVEPSGFTNVGNTCYLNSTLQLLYKIKDLKKKVDSFEPSTSNRGDTSADSIALLLKFIFNKMDKKEKDITPIFFLQCLRKIHPQFAEQGPQGGYKQQDAEEAYSVIKHELSKSLDIENLFKISFKVEQKCLLSPEEEPKITYEDSEKLSCHISSSTNFLKDGVINGLKETIEKHNDKLQTNAEYQISKKITRLPKYLTVQFVRFYWKRDIQKKSKILRKVQFPFEFDVADLLDESIKSEKTSARDKIRKVEKDNGELIRDFKKVKRNTPALQLQQQQEEEEMKLLSIKSKFQDDLRAVLPNVDIDNTNENPSSVYQLQAVISHKGASADSGHYQAWVRDEDDLEGEKWWKFNDEKVSAVDKEKIEQLAGGGEGDSALILLYKAAGI